MAEADIVPQPKQSRTSGRGREGKKGDATPRTKAPKNPPGGYAEEQPGSPASDEPRMKK